MTFVSALILGLLASLHCAAMCGGLQSALQQPMVIRSQRDNLFHLFALNAGRLSTYVAMGSLVSILGTQFLSFADIPWLTSMARYGAALILVLMGLQLLLSQRKPFAWMERFGAGLWVRAQQYLPASKRSKLRHSLQRGLIWGFLPCGLVYGVLISTLLLPSATDAAKVMLGFGLGTLPAMLLTGGLYSHFRSLVQNRAVQTVGGVIFVQGGLLMALAPMFSNTDFMHAYPEVLASMFCYS